MLRLAIELCVRGRAEGGGEELRDDGRVMGWGVGWRWGKGGAHSFSSLTRTVVGLLLNRDGGGGGREREREAAEERAKDVFVGNHDNLSQTRICSISKLMR